MNSWVRTDWWFPSKGARLTASTRELATFGNGLVKVLEDPDAKPEEVEREAVKLIVANRPELAGGQLVGIQCRRFMTWEFLYLHPSLPEMEQGAEATEMVLIPVQGNVAVWVDERGHRCMRVNDDDGVIKIGTDGRCRCDCGTKCPLGRAGMEYRCREVDLVLAGIKIEKDATDG